jgi:hypothetical protein
MEASYEKSMPPPVYIGRTHGEAIIDIHFLFFKWHKLLYLVKNSPKDLIFQEEFLSSASQQALRSKIIGQLQTIGAFIHGTDLTKASEKLTRRQMIKTSGNLVERLILQSPIPVEKTCCFEWGLRAYLRQYDVSSGSWRDFFTRFNKLCLEEKNTHGVLLTELWHHFNYVGNERMETYIRFILYCTHITSGVQLESIPLKSFFSVYKVHFKLSKRAVTSPRKYAQALVDKVATSSSNFYVTSFYNRAKIKKHFKEMNEAVSTIPF